ncbi:hypothetical protein CIPAW_08G168600 [Carya illinoinensis]|uniref:AAA+ ATPase domain-containing protein n=1 Tax=Carya illinoinensis TaxID=32201 RepID=A0A8T1PWV8_CARIL|nr:hypothetical protein CIPAW_08G168600 [Carya illinoinensis]
MEIVILIAETIVKYTVAPVGQWLCYSFQYNNNIKNLENQKEKLQHAQERVKQSVDDASNNGEKIYSDVSKWLTDVDRITELATKRLREIEEAGTRSSNAACLNLKHRHQLSREAKKMGGDIDELLKSGNFNRVSYRPTSQEMVTPINMDCMEFVSRMPTVKGHKEALEDANINVIGLWGMPGVGKTTLMREVARQVKEDKLFDEVAWANVTQSQDPIRQIQGEIADMLDLKLDAESTPGRANHLRKRLTTTEKGTLVNLDDICQKHDLEAIGIDPCKGCKVKEDKLFNEVALSDVTQSPDLGRIQGEIVDMVDLTFDKETIQPGRASRLRERLTTKEKRILVILDDIWEKFDLEAIGIDPYKGCKVVPVSRQRDLLSSQMHVKKMAVDFVAKECGGLPIALVTISKALNNKDLCEWKDALQQLRHPAPEHLTKMQSTIYSCIELSFRHLESQEIQYVFVHCARMEFDIDRLDLVKYCYGLGLFHGINTLEDARNRLYRILRSLKDSCLLQDFPHDSQFCRMHDVVRDVAMLIALRDYGMLFIGDDGGPKEWPDMDALKRCKAFSIRGGDIHHQLPNELECPELSFLSINGRDRSLPIPDTFFQGTKKLKVLVLTAMKLSSLPSSLLLLRNLQTLCLDQCKLGDISAIGELKNLVVLSLLHSDISTLPREIGLLSCLRLFDVSNCSKLEVIPPNILSSLVELEELYMENSFVQWEAEGLFTERSNNANLGELKYMLLLTTLEIHIQDACMLPKDLRERFGKLKRYNILVGEVWDWSDKHGCSRMLKLKLKTSFQSEVVIKMLLNRVECLYLDELKGVKSVLHELDREGFQQLKHLHIQNNDEIKYIISSPMHISTISFPALETFLLKNMTGLEDICHGQLHSTSFCNLRVVKVENCEKLKFVFPSFVVRGLSHLQELQIRECSIMGAIVMKEEGEIEDTDMIFFPQLRHSALEHLPKLISFLRTKNSFATDAGEIVSEDTLGFYMPILHEQIVFPNLETLELSSVQLQETHHNQHRARHRLTTMEAMSRFQNLSNLEVQGSCNIKYLLSFSTARFMVHLKHLHISDCKAMEEVLVLEEIAKASEITEVAFPCLKGVGILRMDYLKHIWQNQFVENSFCNLEFIRVELCENLSVEKLVVGGCSSLQEVFELQELNLKELKLDCLPQMKHVWSKDPKGVFSFKNLKQIWAPSVAKNCGVEEIVEDEGGEDTIERFVFPQVTLLTFKRLLRLKWFYPGVHTLECPMLKKIWVEGCQKVDIFAYGLLSFQETLRESRHEISTQQPLFMVHEVAFPSLETLAISHMDNLITIWHDQVAAESFCSFQNLRQIYVEGCESLKSFFPTVSVATSFRQLEDLHIVNCGIEEIVARGGDQKATPRFVFPRMTTLNLDGLSKLKWFYPGVHTSEWPSLKYIEVNRCKKVKIFASEYMSFREALEESRESKISSDQPFFLADQDQIAFPSLKKLAISHMDNLITIWHDQVAANSFCNIHLLEVKFCESLKSLFPAVLVATSLTQLEILKICNCGIEEIVARGGDQEETPRFVFPHMSILHLDGLEKLKWFYPGVYTSEWPLLKVIWVGGCQKIEIFASEYMSFQETLEESRQSNISSHQPLFLVDQDQVAFPSLEILIITHMDDMKVIWNTQFVEGSFCKLQNMGVEYCANLNSIFPFHMFKVFQSLELLNVVHCSSLKQVFDLQGPSFQETNVITVTQLKHLYLDHLPKLKHISNKDPRDILSFQNLRRVHVVGCESMECLFPASMARTLTELESLVVLGCGVEVIVDEEEAERRLVFPKLTSLALEALRKLKWISPRAYNLELPVLKELRAWGCDQVSIFASKFSRFQETSQQCLLESSIQHPLFLVEEGTFPKLEVLRSNLHDMTTWHDQLFIESFCNLKVLEVQCNHDTSAIFPSNLLKSLQNLEKLVVSCNDWHEIFPFEEFIGPSNHAMLLPQLKELRVSKARMLTHLWKEDIQESLVFHKVLEILAVSKCHKLKSLVPSSILSCNGLIHLITYPTAKSLVQLRKMSVSSCEGITEIMAKGDDQAKVLKGVQATTRGDKSQTDWKNNLNSTIHSLWKNKLV